MATILTGRQIADAAYTEDKCREQTLIDYSKQAGR
jgi:hypothetical protein